VIKIPTKSAKAEAIINEREKSRTNMAARNIATAVLKVFDF
jgi:hypothetical protein